jgi:protein-S-isoprenylcysteine O-methyltransferase Ste14
MSLRNKWIEFLHRVVTGSKRVRTLLTPVELLFFLALIGLFVALSFYVDHLFAFPELATDPWHVVIAAPILAIGVFLMLWSSYHFLRIRGTPVPFNPPPKLVTTGPYAYARNPMMTGLFITLFGLGIWCRSISLVFIFSPLFVLLSAWELKAIEEPELEKRLGKEYIEYKKRVPMFFPWMKPREK